MPTEKHTGNNNLAATIFAVFAVASIAAFLAFRGSDVGQLPKLVGNLGGGPLFGFEGFRDGVVGTVTALIIVFSWFCLGSFIDLFISAGSAESRNHRLDFALKTATGAAAYSLIWFFLGLAGMYNGYAASISTLGGFLVGIYAFTRSKPRIRQIEPDEKAVIFDKAVVWIIAVPLVLTFIASVAPPTAKDTLLYHFALPKAFIIQHSNAFVDGSIASYLALGYEMLNVWAMLLGQNVSVRAGEVAASATTFAFFPLLLTAIYGWARGLEISRRWALIATLMVAAVPTAFHVASSGYIDITLALYVTLAIYSLGRWWSTQTSGWLVMMAIFLGAALSIKLTAVFVIAAFALVILLRARETKDATRKILIGGFAALILAGAIASPWYLRTWKATGSPVFPFYMSIWKGEANGWDVERSNLFQGMNAQYGGEQKNVGDYLLAPANISIIAQPEDARYFDGVLGVAFLIGLPILIWALWKFELPIEAKIGAGIAGIMFLFWLFSSQQLRYLLPIVPVLAIAIAASAEAIANKQKSLGAIWQYSLIVAAIAGVLTTAAWFLQKAPLRVALGGETRDQYLTRNLDYYPYYQTINADTAAGDRVWLINMRRDTYNIDRPVFSDYLFEDWTLRKMVWEARNVQELRAKAAAMNVQYVLARHDFLFDYDRSTLVDDKKPRAENEAKLKIAKDFILDPARTVKADDKFSLIKVF